MSAEGTEPVGDIEEVFQEDGDQPLLPNLPVNVKVEGPVQVHELPSVSGGMRGFSLAAAANGLTKKLVGPDRRRRVIRLWADQPFFFGGSQQESLAGVGARVAANQTIVMTHCDEIWVTLTADGTVSIVVENWAS